MPSAQGPQRVLPLSMAFLLQSPRQASPAEPLGFSSCFLTKPSPISGAPTDLPVLGRVLARQLQTVLEETDGLDLFQSGGFQARLRH